MPCNFSKQPQFLPQKYLNSAHGDAVLQGQLTGVPVGVVASQGNQDLPGDRIIFGPADALALSDPAVGTLYDGLYQYVGTEAGATNPYTRGHAVFWDENAADSLYQVTSDEDNTTTVSDFAGVLINDLTAGYWWWIQIAGKVEVAFTDPLTGTAYAGCGVYVAADGVGRFDVLFGSGPDPDTSLVRFVGHAVVAIPSANNASLIDMPIWRVRW